jgi:hypothetical protein
VVGVSLLTINLVALCEDSMPASGLYHHKNMSLVNKETISLKPRQPKYPAGWPFHTQPLSAHAYKSSWSTHPNALAIPAPCGYPCPLATNASQNYGAGCAGAGQRLPGAVMHDLTVWMTGNVLQITAQGALCARRVNSGKCSMVSHCTSCVSLALAVLQSHLEHFTGTQTRSSKP